MKNFLPTIALMLLSCPLMAQSANKVSTTRQTQGATFGEKVNAGLAAPVQPIVGIIVKGGKAASFHLISKVMAASGEFSFTVTDAGYYTLNLSHGDNPLFQGSVEGATNSRHHSGLRAAPGGPIGGIIVKGGKNPGGNMLILQADEKGTVQLPVLTPGNYTFKVMPQVIKATSVYHN